MLSPGSNREAEGSGRTVEDAIAKTLEELGIERDDAEIEVLDEGSRGVLGLGARDARVRVTVRARQGAVLRDLAGELLGLMGFSPALTVEETPDAVRVAAEGENLAVLIGKHGQTLAAIEAVVGLLAGRRFGAPVRLEFDVMGYRARRRQTLEALAARTADRVTRSKREIALSPMDARDRRVIHVALQGHPQVTTVSRGEEDFRRVVIVPRASGQADPGGPEETGPRGQQPTPPSMGERRTSVDSREIRQRPPRNGAPPTASRSRGQGGGEGRTRGGRPGRAYGRGPQDSRANNRRKTGQGSSGPSPVRPEGLPVDEELEAEIARLEQIWRSSSEQQAKDAPSSGTKDPDQQE